jgi:polysaccharide export outer membrane protein
MILGLLRSLLLAALVAGCAAHPHVDETFEDSLRAPYRLASGDRLRVIVFGQDNLSNVYSVDGSGRISFPLIGAVPVVGQTTRDVEAAIASRLAGNYLREPRVTVEVDTYRPFFVMGEVTTSGQFPFVNGMTVQNAVAIAGGFSPRADQTQARITRIINGQPVTGIVAITHPVRPGDTIVIRERWF